MDQEPNNCKPCKRFCVEPPRLLEKLLAGHQVLHDLAADDLREMCKAREITNLLGLAAHLIERPLRPEWDPGIDLKARNDWPDLGEGYYRALAYWVNVQPMICVRGWLAGAAEAALPVEVYAPLHGAQMAMAAHSMLWSGYADLPLDNEPFSARIRILCWHEPLLTRRGREVLDRFIGYWPAAGFALTIGYDDPALIADILWDVAQRTWEEQTRAGRIVEEEGRLEVVDGRAKFVETESPSPSEWLESLDTLLEEKSGDATFMTPMWANPILPADCLNAGPDWRAAALAAGALPFGVSINIDGEFPTESSKGWIIIPREALPPPMPRKLRRYEIST